MDVAARVERPRAKVAAWWRKSRQGPWRFPVVAALALVGVYVLYVGVANIVLWARVLPGYLDDNDEAVRIHYGSAWTLWPGSVSVEDLRVAHEDSGLQTEFRAAEASASIGLLGLVSQQVVISDLRARDVSIRVRGRRPEANARADESFLPPMATWGPLAIEEPGPAPDTNPSSLWHLVLADTEGTVSEVWIEGVRVTGRMAVSGSFDFMPMRVAIVDDARIRIEDGRVEAIGQPEPLIAERVAGRARFHVAGFDALSHALPDLVRFADVDLDGTGHVFAGRMITAMSEGELGGTDGTGPVEVLLAARQGRFRAGSRVSYETARLGVTSPGGGGHVEDLHVTGHATSDEVAEVRAEAATATGRLPAASKSDVYAEKPSGAIRLRLVPHFMEPSLDGVEVSIPAANMPLVGLDRLTDSVRIHGGIAYLRAKANLDREGKGEGEVHVLLEAIDGAVHGVALKARSRSAFRLTEMRLGDVTSLRAKGTIGIEDLGMVAGDEKVEDWSGEIALAGHLARRGDAPWSVDAEVRANLEDTRPGVAILDGGGFLPGIVADQLAAEGFEVEGDVRRRGPRTQIDVDDARGDGLRVRGSMVDADGDLRASYLVETSLVNVGVSLVRGETQVQVLAGEGWLAREREFLAGFGGAGEPPSATPPDPSNPGGADDRPDG